MDFLDNILPAHIDVSEYPNLALFFLIKLVLAGLLWVVGSFIIGKILMPLTRKAFTRRKWDMTLQNYAGNIIQILLYVILLLIVVSVVGVEATSLAAILAAAGLAIGLALQGALANFAGGFMIVLFRPFKLGDIITAQGETGVVKDIQIFSTIVMTMDNKKVIIPNGPLINNVIVNLTAEETRRIHIDFGIEYDEDIDKAKAAIREVLDQHDQVLKEIPYSIFVSELADSSVNFEVRIWCKTEFFLDINYDIREKVKKAFDRNGIVIPFPQMDVHMDKLEQSS